MLRLAIVTLILSGCLAPDPISQINLDVNRYPYLSDILQFGVLDLKQRISITGKGDCEDYALEKIYRLQELGIEAKLGFLDIGEGHHAVAVVEELVLDSMTNIIYTQSEYCSDPRYTCRF